ncbi:MAG: selenite/tellurite reduction operon rhodanese-like protein ExtH, partial [Desulfuromonadales bacterium]
SLQLFCVLSAALLVWGCGDGSGSSSYDTPQDTNNGPIIGAASNVLIEPATLKTWIDEGLIGNDSGYGAKVVLLDYAGSGDRIVGACRVDSGDLIATRFEGVGDAGRLVATGAQMDAVIQRLGIDADTTIVFTSSSRNSQARAYWTFRYWGFPKDRLRVLNGNNTAFAAEYPQLMTDVAPTATPSTYSVRNLAGLNDDLRASVGEMVTIISQDLTTSDTDIVFDARGSRYYLGTAATSGLIESGTKVVVDGHPTGGFYIDQSGNIYDAATDKYLSAEEIAATFGVADWPEGMKATVYCTSGFSASPLFFSLDAILGMDVQLYDGSWSQLGKYSDYTVAGGQLPGDSPWSIDDYLDPATRVYNKFAYLTDSSLLIETLDAANAVDPQPEPFTGDDPLSNDDVVQSQVEAADIAYADGTGAVVIPAAVATATPGVMIEAPTLQGWMDLGLLDVAPGAGERVVVLDVTSAANYAAGHIPGALHWDTAGQVITRTEGPAPAVNMVLDGASMDARIQALGIDNNTTIVFTTTSGNRSFFPGKAYFTFRYWGWPKDRLKILNGFNSAWSSLTTFVPTPTATTLSVADLATGAQLDTRVSLAELMDAARDARGTAIDMRGDKIDFGSTSGVFSDVPGDFVVFEGRINGGTYYNYADFQVSGSDRFKSAADIVQEMAAAGIDIASFSADGSYTNPVYSYCRTAYIASTGFLVLDAILDIDVMVYDGSWSQWGKMSDNAEKGGELPVDSPWAVDNADYMSIINYNADSPSYVIEPLNPDAAALTQDPAETNQVEEADYDYQIQAPAPDSDSDGGSAPTPGGGDTPSVGC